MRHLQYSGRFIRHSLCVPITYLMIIPLFICDIMGEFYHRICFPLCGIPFVKRSDYIVVDRHKLKYLTPIQKINCMYCGYVNGFCRYMSAIAAETEKYWCGIMHNRGKIFPHQAEYLPYGDEQALQDLKNKRGDK